MSDSMQHTHTTDALHLGWSWCGYCKRSYHTGSYRKVQLAGRRASSYRAALKLCPYPGCGGSATRDRWNWSTVRVQHPEYPEYPELNTYYGTSLRF